MSRLESGMLKLKTDWCDLSELIHSVIEKLQPGGNHFIVFNPNENLPFFRLDAGIIEQIVSNLLHNAIHHNPVNTRIHIDVVCESDLCIITISDNGNGFPEHEIPLVFNKFYRLPENKSGGSGLGLSIVKGFVESLNGTIRLENNKTGGARFTIRIPAEATYINSLKNE
jgi:two-component system sensor histidine kinase KdpD